MGGGPMSHQRGLEVDIGLDMRPRAPMTRAQRDAYEQPTLVRPDRRGVEMSRWNQGVITLLRLAASLPDVDRVLVNPAIKKQLCEDVTGDRSWLRLIRPFYAHAAHLHLTFKCPAGQAECRNLPPLLPSTQLPSTTPLVSEKNIKLTKTPVPLPQARSMTTPPPPPRRGPLRDLPTIHRPTAKSTPTSTLAAPILATSERKTPVFARFERLETHN